MSEPVPQSRRPTVVIVEDDSPLSGALKFALEAEGFDIRSYTAAAPLIERPVVADCLVVDLRLPDMDGLSLIAKLRERGINAPAILITTNPDERCRDAAKAAGVQIVEKPLIDEELRRRISEAIDGARS
jgi:FixJ family two-component response regulator